ncbi:MAG: translocation/assembly module TamB [Bacteroidales bacterium]|nr:translocation/assembly module TamB [Bacteroidales bacterium]
MSINRKKSTFATNKGFTTIKKISYLVRSIVGIVLGLYLGILLFTALPACQHWLAAKASDVLSRQLGTEVAIGNVQVGLFNRLVIDDVLVLDQQGDTLLAAARLSAKTDVLQFLKGHIRFSNVQLFGYDIRLRRRTADTPYNFQFILDRFAGKDTTTTPLDLRANSIIIRRGTLSHDLDFRPRSDRFTPAHLRLQDLDIRASINTLTNDTISLDINELSFVEKCSGFVLNDLSAHLEGTPENARLTEMNLLLPQTKLHLPELVVRGHFEGWDFMDVRLTAEGEITPADLQHFLPSLASFVEPVKLSAQVEKQARDIALRRLRLTAEGADIDLLGRAHLNKEDTALRIPFDDMNLQVQRLEMATAFYEPVLRVISHAKPATLPQELVSRLCLLGDVRLSGFLQGRPLTHQAVGDLQLSTALGKALVRGQLQEDRHYHLHAETEEILLASLFQGDEIFPVNRVSLTADVEGHTGQRTAQGSLALHNLEVKGKDIDRITADFSLQPDALKADLRSDDDEYALRLTADLHHISNTSLNLSTLETLQGQVRLEDVRFRSARHNYDLNQLKLTLHNDDKGHHLSAHGDFIDAQADGPFQFTTLVPTVQHFLHQALPSLIPPTGKDDPGASDQVAFKLRTRNANGLFQLLNIDVQLPEAASVEGTIDGSEATMELRADLPRIIYGSEDLRDISLLAQQELDSVHTFLTIKRMIEAGPIELEVATEGRNDVVKAAVKWDDHQSPAQRGQFEAVTRFFRDENRKLGAELNMNQGQLVISDTVWNVRPSKVMLHNDVLNVEGFEVAQLGRHLRVNGRVSKNPADTLYADLQGINLQYVFGLINFHDVEFAGFATGSIKVHDLFKGVQVDADLQVNDFTLNDGLLGKVFVTGGFGRKDDRAIDIDAYIHEPVHHEISHVAGLIKPGHEEGRGMTLDIQARYLNTYFINSFTEGIFTDLQGRASGHAYLHGPFKRLDLEGELVVDTLSTTIDVLGTHYHTLGGDSIHLHPGGIRFTNVKVFDEHHVPGTSEHCADLNGELRFRHFKNMHYDFDITAHNLLGYDFRDFGDQSFYGTVFADGNVRLSGQPGSLTVDLRCRPTRGTVFTYNVSTPETITDNEFITFVNPKAEEKRAMARRMAVTDDDKKEEEPNDMHINFDLDITPDAQMRLLMDPVSEDYINLYGNGHIRAQFYNKGRFQMYGTYRVDHGTYRLSLQDVIRKDFHFQPGGTIVFGGQPLKAALDLQAVYTVPSVSLNDLAAGSNFSNSSVRVNCLMNLGGQAESPQVTFDFDIPNVNEDEKQMVRSLISTDEERNLQVIYLLGIGRFYTYGLGADQSQTNAAVQSLLSSTLSGQLNDLLSSVIGNGNWNFGTNLSTGNMGWQDMDVEGSLSGRLLNNRLLINGTFGYRDTPIANTNFIGDFDVQWLLTKSGNLSLKAYSETNDRYFTKTALTTQGIGIQVKKDFDTLKELFTPKR